jgi:hypothetical protein
MKHPKSDRENKIKGGQPEKIDHPVFCFKHLHEDYHLRECDNQEKKCLIERIVLLSSCTWNKLQLAPRHGIGSEKIAKNAIRASIPHPFDEDYGDPLAFRFDGMKTIVGFRKGFLFHVIYIDRNFTLYAHG